MPVDHADLNYAYVIEYRPLDRCFTPSCSLKSNDVSGFSRELSPEGEPGRYVAFGDPKSEIFYRRARILRKNEELSFDLPESEAASEFEADFSAAERGSFAGTIVFQEIRPSAPATTLSTLEVSGSSHPQNETIDTAHGSPERYFKHVRVPIPSRKGKRIRVVVKASEYPLAVASPLVMKRVERKAHQVFFVIFDAVPYPIFTNLFHDGTREKQTEWLTQEIRKRGLYFPDAQVPGMNTATYGRRFMRNDMYRTDGEQALTGQGIDETPPEVVPTFIARLAEQGFRTEIFADNFTLLPYTTRLGNDGGYNSEFSNHPQIISSLFEAWLKDHSHDDAFFLLWSARTHDTLTNVRVGPDLPIPLELQSQKLNRERLNGLWHNALESVDALLPAFSAARALSPHAERLWTIGTDHGQAMTAWLGGQSFRLPLHGTATGASHGVFGSIDETRTPFAAIYDGDLAPQHGAPRTIDEHLSQLNQWRLVEDAFGIQLGLPETTQYDSSSLHPERIDTKWADLALFSVGNGGAIRAFADGWAYRSFTKNFRVDKLWKCSPTQQLALRGTPRLDGPFIAEELYRTSEDALEMHSVASKHPDTIATMRWRTADFIAAHSDRAGHPRYVQTLRFAEPVDVTVSAPHPFRMRVDGVDTPLSSPRSASVHGKKIEIIDDVEPTSVIDVRGASISSPLVLKCGNGLPVDALTPSRTRLNLGVARTNCVAGAAGSIPVERGTIAFSFETRKASGPSTEGNAQTFQGASGAGSQQQNAIMDGMKRWGYVRDQDKKH